MAEKILKQYIDKVINKGDASGNGMTVRFRLPSGLEIYGLPTKNFYGGHWDLGPTWNYAVMADRPFLVDAGRFGQGKNLVGMMESVGNKYTATGSTNFAADIEASGSDC
jgi:hypothetical protein